LTAGQAGPFNRRYATVRHLNIRTGG